MLSKLDTWVGKHLFVPPIIRFCQWRGITQHVFANYANWLSGALILTNYRDLKHWWQYVLLTIVVLALLLETIFVALKPGMARKPDPFWRKLVLVFLIQDVVLMTVAVIHDGVSPDVKQLFSNMIWSYLPWKITWLAALYARTITTIPPLEAKQRQTSGSGKLAPVKVTSRG